MELSAKLNICKEEALILLPLIYISLGTRYLYITIQFLWFTFHFDIGRNPYISTWFALLPWLSVRYGCVTDAWIEVDWGFFKYSNGIRLFRRSPYF